MTIKFEDYDKRLLEPCDINHIIKLATIQMPVSVD